ncbi:hypothetical protein [Arthrobacter sp. CG_A4]|uniref:hypothetical protein n=1 Tax=Arthrobacter sp. CG_A4 TaxID=3071706 RepID=UPI002E00C8A3|nr:Co/Zn/Cd efflux system component [Arthrobacter sp. CG_A4]
MTESPRARWQELLRRTPLWLIALVVAVGWAAIQLGMRLLQGKEVVAEDIALTSAFGVVVGIFVLWFGRRVQAKERKLPPGSPTAANINKAISTGQLPEQASAEQWEAELIWILIRDRHTVWVAPLVFGLFTALALFLIFDNPEHPWFGVVCAVLFVGGG